MCFDEKASTLFNYDIRPKDAPVVLGNFYKISEVHS